MCYDAHIYGLWASLLTTLPLANVLTISEESALYKLYIQHNKLQTPPPLWRCGVGFNREHTVCLVASSASSPTLVWLYLMDMYAGPHSLCGWVVIV